MKILIIIIFAALAALLVSGCQTRTNTASMNWEGQTKHLLRDLPPSFELIAHPGEEIRMQGVARLTVSQPDFRTWQMIRREPGAIEATIRDIAPTALLATGAYLGYRENARTSRHNAALSTQERLGTYRIFGDIATDNGDPLDVTEFLGQAQAGVIAGVNAGGQIAQDSQLVGPVNLQPLIDPLPVFIPEP